MATTKLLFGSQGIYALAIQVAGSLSFDKSLQKKLADSGERLPGNSQQFIKALQRHLDELYGQRKVLVSTSGGDYHIGSVPSLNGNKKVDALAMQVAGTFGLDRSLQKKLAEYGKRLPGNSQQFVKALKKHLDSLYVYGTRATVTTESGKYYIHLVRS